jgi:hypothetical protein
MIGGDKSIENNYQEGVLSTTATACLTISHNMPAMLH